MGVGVQTSINGSKSSTSPSNPYPMSNFMNQPVLMAEVPIEGNQSPSVGLGMATSANFSGNLAFHDERNQRNDAFWQSQLNPVVIHCVFAVKVMNSKALLFFLNKNIMICSIFNAIIYLVYF